MKGADMPLSDHEQRILNSLEESLENDPHFVGTVEALKSSARSRQTRIVSVIVFLIGTAVMVAFFTQSVLAGIIGVALMFASSLAFTATLDQRRSTWRR